MSSITKIDEKEITEYKPINEVSNGTVSGIGLYNECIYDFLNEVFQPDDTSTVRDVLDTLNFEVGRIETLIEGVDVMFDTLIERIDDDILSKEDKIANNLSNSL